MRIGNGKWTAAAGIIAAVLPALTSLPAVGGIEDQTGKHFSFASLGRPAVVTFVASHCVDTCPIINGQYTLLQQQIIRRKLDVTLVTLTLDPEHDSQADMRRMARQFQADPKIWKLVTGNDHDIHALMRRFNVSAASSRGRYADEHTTFVYFVDRSGILRKTMLASPDLSASVFSELFRDWRLLAK